MPVVLVTPMHATFPVYLLPLDLITLIIPDLYFVRQILFVTSHRYSASKCGQSVECATLIRDNSQNEAARDSSQAQQRACIT
jgi:hypothetical protein